MNNLYRLYFFSLSLIFSINHSGKLIKIIILFFDVRFLKFIEINRTSRVSNIEYGQIIQKCCVVRHCTVRDVRNLIGQRGSVLSK